MAQPGASPRAALNPRTYRAIKGAAAIADDIELRLTSIEQQQAVAAKDLGIVVERLKAHEESQAQDPAVIAVLQTKISAILWLASILVLSSLGWMIKQMRDSAQILHALRQNDDLRASRHGELVTRLDTVDSEINSGPQKP